MRGTMTFTRPGDVMPDDERPGLLRAQPNWDDADGGDVRVCELRDLAAADAVEPGLEAAGFETIDLSANSSLQRALKVVLDTDCITDATGDAIRHSLAGSHIGLANGASLRVDHVVDDGLIHRRSGPNGLSVSPGGIIGANGHDSARYVHGDQDVFGTPLQQLMHGAAPDTFRHLTPDGRNDAATTFLLNLWIPLHAPIQPLVLMDRRTLDAPRHQLRYGLPVAGFLGRDAELSINDIWSFLYDEGQTWHFRSDMGPSQAYVFDTLGTPHGAAALAGEAELAELFEVLGRLCTAHDSHDAKALQSTLATPVPAELPVDVTPTIRHVWRAMLELHEHAEAMGVDPQWCAQARVAMDSVVRRSVETRMIATLIDN